MKFNLNNPAFLQMAGNLSRIPETRFVFTTGRNQVQLAANGSVVIESVQGGEKVRETYNALNYTDVIINADDGTEIVIYGAVTILNQKEEVNLFASLDVSKNTALTELYCNECMGLTSLDLSKNTALMKMDCGYCPGLTNLDVSKNTELFSLLCGGCPDRTSLDVSKNTALTEFDCADCPGLTSINGIAVNSEVSAALAAAITNATSVDGTVTLRQGDEFNQTIIDAAMEKGWDVQYYS